MPNLSTDGIEIGTAEWTVKVVRENETKEVTLTTWDFAGTGSRQCGYSSHTKVPFRSRGVLQHPSSISHGEIPFLACY